MIFRHGHFQKLLKRFFELLVLKDTLVIPKILTRNISKDVPLEFVVFSFFGIFSIFGTIGGQVHRTFVPSTFEHGYSKTKIY